MNEKISCASCIATCMAVVFMMGCAAPEPPAIVYTSGPTRPTTLGVGALDYDLAAEELVKRMMHAGLPQGYVVALGPVDVSTVPSRVDVKRLQLKLKAAFSRERTLRFVYLEEAMGGTSAWQQRYKITDYNDYNQNPESAEELRKYARSANINGILFGTISYIEEDAGNGRRLGSYYFNWALGDTQTGEERVNVDYDLNKLKPR